MNKYLKLLFVALFATLSFALVSCGDDDDDNSGLIGTWEYSFVDPDDGWQYYGTFTFNEGGTYTLTETEFDGVESDTYTVSGVYTLSGDLSEGAVVRLDGRDADGDVMSTTMNVRRSGNKLYCTDEDGEVLVLTKQ